MIEQAVILAAGRGTRLGELTRDRAKSMLPILGKPILARVMDQMREAGVRRFVVVVGPHEHEIPRYLRATVPDEIRFAVQQVPTGTVDALQLAAPHLDGPFLLAAVDNLTAPSHVRDLVARFDESSPMATLSLLPAPPETIRRSSDVVIQNGCITAIEEKPEHPRSGYASIMLYAFAPEFLSYLLGVPVSPRGEREIVSGIQAAISDGHNVTYAVTDWRLHLTRELDLLRINRQFLRDGVDSGVWSELPASVAIVDPVRVDPGVSVGAGACIGPRVYLEAGAVVGENATIADAVVLAGAAVPAGRTVRNMLVDRRVEITEA